MKVGFSLGRCLRDIYAGDVSVNDVVVIIASTQIDPRNDEHWNQIWNHYTVYTGPWSEFGSVDNKYHNEAIRQIVKDLHAAGKLHQPRNYIDPKSPANFMASIKAQHYHWMELVLIEPELLKNVTAKEAWEQFQTVAGLLYK